MPHKPGGLSTTDGSFLDFSTMPERDGARAALIAKHEVIFDPLEDDELDVNPADFISDVADYIREALGLKKRPECAFAASGRIEGKAYWVFTCPATNPPMYGMMRWEAPYAEFLCCEAALGEKPLSPVQAAAIEHLVDEVAPPLDVDD